MKLTAILAAGLTFACTFAQAQQKTDTAKTLTKVTVTGHRPLVEHLIDRTVINADALPGKEGSTLMDLLEKSPGVTVEQNTIQLQGRDGVTIYIDDKPTYLSGDALANYLRSRHPLSTESS
jgi:outer membrane cobalamin receptor